MSLDMTQSFSKWRQGALQGCKGGMKKSKLINNIIGFYNYLTQSICCLINIFKKIKSKIVSNDCLSVKIVHGVLCTTPVCTIYQANLLPKLAQVEQNGQVCDREGTDRQPSRGDMAATNKQTNTKNSPTQV